MKQHTADIYDLFISPEERVLLLRFCATFTRNTDIAEDLAQETLMEAWRNKHKLREPAKQHQWLFGIARNVCLRWQRASKHSSSYLLQATTNSNHTPFEISNATDILADDLDVELMFERRELTQLLEDALTRLPFDTRTVLVQHYIEEIPLATIATQMETNIGAIAMRLHRGKRFLRKLFMNEMHEDMLQHIANLENNWEKTPLWCTKCGQQNLWGQRNTIKGKLLLKCPACLLKDDTLFNESYRMPALIGVKGYKNLFSRLFSWCDDYYRSGLSKGIACCTHCGKSGKISIITPSQFPAWSQSQRIKMWQDCEDDRVVAQFCEYCRTSCIISLESLALTSPQGQNFLQTHPRIRTLPVQNIEFDGRIAVLSQFESVTDTARIEIISAADTFETLHHAGSVG